MSEKKLTPKQLENLRIKEEKARAKEEKEKLRVAEKLKKQKEKEAKIAAKEAEKKAKADAKLANTNKGKLLEETFTQKLTEIINNKNAPINYEPKVHVLKDSGITITHIIHIADVHIRLSVRHDEYNEVFKNFYEMLRKHVEIHPNSIICLCGDLLHSKDELKPNTIIQTWNFIRNMAEILPLIIITGNHDTIELNENKIDSITAILKDRNFNNIYYLVDSGAYIYNNLIFGVSSIIDKYILNVNKVKELTTGMTFNYDMINVGLYHGAIDSVLINQYGTRIRGNRKLADFGDYDYLLLGDIHHFQYINKTKTAAYASSLIAQNYTETDDYHGYILWDLENTKSDFMRVKNDYGYHTISLEKLFDKNDNSLLNDDLIKSQLSNINKGYLRIEVSDSYSMNGGKTREIFKEQILNIYPDIKITWQVIFTENKTLPCSSEIISTNNTIDTNQVDIKKNDLEIKQDQLIVLIKRFLDIKYNDLNEESKQSVIKCLIRTLDENKSSTKIEYVQSEWKLIWLSFDYMYGYGPNNVIDFTLYPMNEIVGIFGDNAIGKSSLIDIITYMLYSKSARDESAYNPKDIVNVNTDKAWGILIIESNGIKYRIDRSCKKKWNNSNKSYSISAQMFVYKMIPMIHQDGIEDDVIKNDPNIFKLHGQTYKLSSMTEENRMYSDDTLVPIIGSYDNFITTSVLLQGNTKTFKSKTNVQKKDFLSQILNIDYLRTTESIISGKAKNYKTEVEALTKTFSSLSNKTIDEIKDEITNNTNTITEQNQYIENIENELSSKRTELNHLIAKTGNILPDELRKKLTELVIVKENYDQEIKNTNAYIDEINYKIKKLDLLDNIDEICANYKQKKQVLAEKEIDIMKDIEQIEADKDALTKRNDNDLTEKDINNMIDETTNKYKDARYELILQIENWTANTIQSLSTISLNYANVEYYELMKETQHISKNLLLCCYVYGDINATYNDNIMAFDNIINNANINIEELTKKMKTFSNKYHQISNINEEELIKNIKNTLHKYNILFNPSNITQQLIDDIYIIIDEIKNKLTLVVKNIDIDDINNEINEINIFLQNNTNNIHDNNTDVSVKSLLNIIKTELEKTRTNKQQCISLVKQVENKLENEPDDIISKKHKLDELLNIRYNYEKSLEAEQLEDIVVMIDNLNKINKNKENDIICKNIQAEIDEYSNIINVINNIKKCKFNAPFDKLCDDLDKLYELKENIEYNTIITNKKNELNCKIKKLKTDLECIYNDDDVLLYDELQEQIAENDKLKREMEMNCKMINAIKLKANIVDSEIEDINQKLKDNTNSGLYDKLEKCKENYNDLCNDMEKYKISNATLNTINSNNKSILQKLTDTKKDLDNASTEHRIHDIMTKVMSRDGIQLFLLSESLGKITNKVNSILEPFIQKTINMEMHGDKIEINIHNTNGNKIQTISGMESLMLELTLKIIIGQISVMPKSSVLFIDESISVLDKHRLSSIDELFEFVKQYYSQVLLITHMKQVNNHINHTLDITKINGASLIYNLPGNKPASLDITYSIAIDKIKRKVKKQQVIDI